MGRARSHPGDAPGFVQVLNDDTLLIPDRPGNNQLYTLQNVVENPNVSLIFFVPGIEETLRIVGSASIERDEAILQRFAVNGKTPKTAMRITVKMATLHCGKALKRSKLWDPARHVDRTVIPTLGQMIIDQAKPQGMTVEHADAFVEKQYKEHLY